MGTGNARTRGKDPSNSQIPSQSEPNQAIPGLLTPRAYDEQGHPTDQDLHPSSMHARGLSSVSQLPSQQKPFNTHAGPYQRTNPRFQQLPWDGWSHSAAYGLSSDESPPLSVATDISIEDEDIDEAWDVLEKLAITRNRYNHRSRRTNSRDDDPRSSDTDENYTTDSTTSEELPRSMRVSVGPNGKPLVDFPIPRGPQPEALIGANADPALLQKALWQSTLELRDGLRASRDLLKAMKLEDVRPPEGFLDKSAEDEQNTVRIRS